MGGDGHGHHTPMPKVPDYRIYKVDKSVPLLMKLEGRLAKEGLKDPWIRNEVWRFREEWWGTPFRNLLKFVFRGFFVGAAATAVVIGTTKLMYGDDDHGHGHAHESHKKDEDKSGHH